MATYAHGIMTIAFSGITFELAANVRAARAISGHLGGLTKAYQKANDHDFDTLVAIINAASGRTAADVEATAEAVFAEGVINVAPQIIAYLGFLASGGKVVDVTVEKGASSGEF